jgi:serine/threonine protein kinase
VIAGRYSLEREIGRGGTGPVWLGRDDVLGRRVAIKRIGLLPGADTTDVARAEREARLSARLSHPHIVSVFDVVADEATHEHWLVMEYVDGVTLGQLVQQEGPLSPDEAAPLLWQVADALAAAHAAGIAHRDVKPSNVLIDHLGIAKLNDFGIARIATDPALTQTGLMTGSPAYLAPEVARGGRGDSAADVWSLGATAYHVLAGRPPYEIGDNVLGALYRIVNEPPPRLAEAGWLAPLLEATMVRDPARRWSMTQVRDFLGRPDAAVLPLPTIPLAPDEPAPDELAPDDPVSDQLAPGGGTRVLGTVPTPTTPTTPTTPAAASAAPPPGDRPLRRPSAGLLVGLGAAALVALVVLFAALSQDDPGSDATPPASSPSVAATPTAEGIESFIRDYVATVAADPDAAWTMLTPKFQRESGGIQRYREFWDSATNGEVLSIETDPADLEVSYHVHFDNFDNGPGPTVLDLTFQDGRYLIDGERTQGFKPAG